MEQEILSLARTCLIDKNKKIDTDFQFKLQSNRDARLLITLNDLLQECDEFIFSVAFVKDAGVKSLFNAFSNAKSRNIKGKILVGNKQFFSDPSAIKELSDKFGFDVRLNTNNKMHTKGYFFRVNNTWKIIIGSSNLTDSALTINEEWNIIISSLENGELVENSLRLFNELWRESKPLSESIDWYTKEYDNRKRIELNYKREINLIENITPNKMQVEALASIKKMRQSRNKAIVISATGTGKTYLSAFDVRSANPKKMLFIVHVTNVAMKAKESFERIIKNKVMGMYTGNEKSNADYLFCTIQTLTRDNHLNSFDPYEFDYIIFDEVHHSGAKSYQKVMNYFKPKFLLGLTATPERTDGFNIYEFFDYNIAYEIRLNDAIESEIIVPFHYFGVSEVLVNGRVVDNKTKVEMSEKAKNIKEKSEYYGFSGEKVRGLIFVDNKENGEKLKNELNLLKYKCSFISSNTSENDRDLAFNQLSNNTGDYLDFIISVDVLNEGVDIPCVNQVLLLRPTKSAIVYVQQLGRGLRKSTDKDYLVILDFIGNYKENFLIPVALSDDYSYNADFIRRFVENGNEYMPGKCTVTFEKIAGDLVLSKVNNKKDGKTDIIKKDYKILKNRLNKVPNLTDFLDNNKISPEYILKYEKCYYDFLKKVDKTYNETLSKNELEYLRYLSKEFSMSKRVHEFLIIKLLLEDKKNYKIVNKKIENILNIPDQIENTRNAIQHLSHKIFKLDNCRRLYSGILENGKLKDDFKKSYNENVIFRGFIEDLINVNLKYVSLYYKQETKSSLVLYHDYSRKECFHMINQDYAPQEMTGYKELSDEKRVMILFKTDKSSYGNVFFNDKEFTWFSQKNKNIERETPSRLEKEIAENKKILEVFAKKVEGDNYYYLGEAEVVSSLQTKENDKDIVKYHLKLKNSIRKDIYRTLTI